MFHYGDDFGEVISIFDNFRNNKNYLLPHGYEETKMKNSRRKVFAVAMSGGVDSSVVAALLQNQGHDVFGITMDIHENCVQDLEDAAEVCKKLLIPHYVVDVRARYKEKVIDLFVEYYSKGFTPNPCALCNRDIKLNFLLDVVMEKGADFMATGHYAKLQIHGKNVLLSEALNLQKDQSYFVSLAPREKLKYVQFPLGNTKSKDETRKMAAEFNLPNFEKDESQDICFIRNESYKEFLKKISGTNLNNAGNIKLLKTGKIIGQHNGIVNYTVGQRKGLGISHEIPLYVVKLNPESNDVIVGEKKDLDIRSFSIFSTNWLVDSKPEFEAFVKLRSFGKKSKAIIKKNDENAADIQLLEKSPTPVTSGQICAIYSEGNMVLGGGIIINNNS
jgi:tRNA-specific 2-thiouridylase